MKTIGTTWDNVTVGDDITVWLMPRGYSGQGGTVQAITAGAVSLVCGTDRYERTITSGEAHHLTMEVPFDATECLDFNDQCSGPVEMFAPGSGNAFPRCLFHRDKRQKSYEGSLERYADSPVEADWFDPSYAGEAWGPEDY